MTANNASTAKKQFYLNPFTYFSGFYLVQITLLPLAYFLAVPQLVNPEYYLLTFVISVINYLSVAAGYALAPFLGARLAKGLFSTVQLRFSGNSLTLKERGLISGGLFCLYLAMFSIHMVVSGGGLLWITNSRQAYAEHRIGVGPTYSFSITFLYLSLIFALFSINLGRPAAQVTRGVAARVMIFAFFAYFFGSKGYVISVATVGLLFYNYNFRPVRPRVLILFAAAGLAAVVGLLYLQGSATDTEGVVSYADYFQNTSEFLRRFHEFGGYRWGEVMVSDLWSYVPRGLYANKPYEYGNLLLDQVMFPGAAEVGYTPAFLGWATTYLDFGVPGVIVISIYNGLFIGWLNLHYVSQPSSAARFILLLQMGFVAVFPWVPLLVFILIVLPLLSLTLMGCRAVFFWLKYGGASPRAVLEQAGSGDARSMTTLEHRPV